MSSKKHNSKEEKRWEEAEKRDPGGEEIPIEELLGKIETLEAKDAEWEDRYMRLAAEFDNYRKRQGRIFEEMVNAAQEVLILKILDVLDNFERALESTEEPLDTEAVIEGVSLIYKQMLDLLASEDIESICPEGECFDPNVHEAVSVVPGETEEGKVLDVIQKGYRKGNRLVRPARVVVSTPKPEEDES